MLAETDPRCNPEAASARFLSLDHLAYSALARSRADPPELLERKRNREESLSHRVQGSPLRSSDEPCKHRTGQKKNSNLIASEAGD